MRRIAAHYIWYKQVLPIHYIEVNDAGEFIGVYPLVEEIAGTAFLDGVIIPLPAAVVPDIKQIFNNWEKWTDEVVVGSPVHLYRITGLPLSAAKFGTDDGCSHCHIERL